MIDTNILLGGSRYQELKKSYIVFFCTFDPFGKGLKRYTFENQCLELPGFKLNDDSIKIFFNSKGKDTNSLITKEQDNLLKYLNTGEVTDDFTKQLKEAVEEIKGNKKWRAEYMHTLVHEQDIRDEGIALGRLEMIQNALKSGSSPDEIARILGISLEEVSKAQEEMCEPAQ